jgi:hypothetical protein
VGSNPTPSAIFFVISVCYALFAFEQEFESAAPSMICKHSANLLFRLWARALRIIDPFAKGNAGISLFEAEIADEISVEGSNSVFLHTGQNV